MSASDRRDADQTRVASPPREAPARTARRETLPVRIEFDFGEHEEDEIVRPSLAPDLPAPTITREDRKLLDAAIRVPKRRR